MMQIYSAVAIEGKNLGLKFKNTGACMDALQLSHQLSAFLPSLFPKKKQYIEDIYFFEVNTIYISSNVLKISEISRVPSTSEIADIFQHR